MPNPGDELSCFHCNQLQGESVKYAKSDLKVLRAYSLHFLASSSSVTFLPVFLKQRGLTFEELHFINSLAGAATLLVSVLSGFVVDKMGRSKPVMVGFLVAHVVSMAGLLLCPSVRDCSEGTAYLETDEETNRTLLMTDCGRDGGRISFESCAFLRNLEVANRTSGNDSAIETALNVTAFLPLGDIELRTATKQKVSVNGTDFCHFPGIPANVTLPRGGGCHRQQCVLECTTVCSKSSNTVSLYLLLYLLMYCSLANTYRLFDAVTMTLVSEYGSDFGKHRVFAVAGNIVGPVVTGFAVGALSSSADYSYALLICVAILIPCFISVFALDVRADPPGVNMVRKSVEFLMSPDVIISLLVLLVLGTNFAFNVISKSWFLETIGASPLLIGCVISMGNVYGLPVLYTAHWWISKIGERNVFLLALFSYFVSNVSYSMLTQPWVALLIETTKIVNYHLLWVAAVQLFEDLAPDGLRVTVLNIMGVIHYSVGRTTAGTLGNLVKRHYDMRACFLSFGILAGSTFILYLCYLLWRMNGRAKRVYGNVPQNAVSSTGL